MRIKSITEADAKGTREYMEDHHFIFETTDGTLLAVFDGHGGRSASFWAWQGFTALFLDSLAFFSGDVVKAFSDSIKKLALELLPCEAGTTFSAVYVPHEGPQVAYTAVLGDSPIIIQSSWSAPFTGPDHNVRTNPAERKAAEDRGGYCDGSYLFKGFDSMGLQMARALGDAHLRGVLSTEPEINTVPIVGEGFILVATDGLFDPAHRHFEASKSAILAMIEDGATAQQLVDCALEQETHDNVTAILARF